MKKILVTFLIIAAFVAGYFFSKNYNIKLESKTATAPLILPTVEISKKPTASPTKEESMVGNDSDIHGCKGSAGYTWCEEKSKCLRVWEEPCVDEEAIKQALVAKHGWNTEDIIFTVSKSEGSYASGGIREKEAVGGGMWFAAEVGGEWQIVFDGNGVITCASLVDYPDFPTSMIPECYNETTGQMVTR